MFKFSCLSVLLKIEVCSHVVVVVAVVVVVVVVVVDDVIVISLVIIVLPSSCHDQLSSVVTDSIFGPLMMSSQNEIPLQLLVE